MDPAMYPATNKLTVNQTVPGRDIRCANLLTGGHDYGFNITKLPANLFLQFAAEYITQGMYDKGHNSISVRSIMVGILGSYNSKYIKDEK
jgi:hypothetical protein